MTVSITALEGGLARGLRHFPIHVEGSLGEIAQLVPWTA
jgi:hypothetical protein